MGNLPASSRRSQAAHTVSNVIGDLAELPLRILHGDEDDRGDVIQMLGRLSQEIAQASAMLAAGGGPTPPRPAAIADSGPVNLQVVPAVRS